MLTPSRIAVLDLLVTKGVPLSEAREMVVM
jgi:hypothetical protein